MTDFCHYGVLHELTHWEYIWFESFELAQRATTPRFLSGSIDPCNTSQSRVILEVTAGYQSIATNHGNLKCDGAIQ